MHLNVNHLDSSLGLGFEEKKILVERDNNVVAPFRELSNIMIFDSRSQRLNGQNSLEPLGLQSIAQAYGNILIEEKSRQL